MVRRSRRQNRRWYEQNPIIHDAVETWQIIPKTAQRALAMFILKHVIFKPKSSKGIFQSCLINWRCSWNQWRQTRWYDRDQDLQKAVQSMIPLAHHEQLQIARGILRFHAQLRHGCWKRGRHPVFSSEFNPILFEAFACHFEESKARV